MALQSASRQQVDIIILTVIPKEMHAARAALRIPEKARFKDDAGTIFYRGKVHSACAQRHYDIILRCIGKPGNPDAAAAISDMLVRYSPQAVLLMGIAAGVRGKVKIGEVVLSERIVAYEPAVAIGTPEGDSRQESRSESQPIPYRMLQAIVNYRPNPARLRQRFEEEGGTFPSSIEPTKESYQKDVAAQIAAKPATIASGEKLLRDSRKLREILSINDKIEAIEMEAVGLMKACELNDVSWLVIRGISDFGDEHKDDQFHDFASRTAAATLADFIDQGLDLPNLKKPRPSTTVAAVLLSSALAFGSIWFYGIPHLGQETPAIQPAVTTQEGAPPEQPPRTSPITSTEDGGSAILPQTKTVSPETSKPTALSNTLSECKASVTRELKAKLNSAHDDAAIAGLKFDGPNPWETLVEASLVRKCLKGNTCLPTKECEADRTNYLNRIYYAYYLLARKSSKTQEQEKVLDKLQQEAHEQLSLFLWDGKKRMRFAVTNAFFKNKKYAQEQASSELRKRWERETDLEKAEQWATSDGLNTSKTRQILSIWCSDWQGPCDLRRGHQKTMGNGCTDENLMAKNMRIPKGMMHELPENIDMILNPGESLCTVGRVPFAVSFSEKE